MTDWNPDELPGMWELADLVGGETDAYNEAEARIRARLEVLEAEAAAEMEARDGRVTVDPDDPETVERVARCLYLFRGGREARWASMVDSWDQLVRRRLHDEARAVLAALRDGGR